MTQQPTVVSVVEARANFAELIGQVQYGSGVIEIRKHGKTAAYLISPEQFERAREAGALDGK